MSWIKASAEKPKGKVLVVFLNSAFGQVDPLVTVAYYDPPENYNNAKSAVGWLDWSSGRALFVTHWQPIPELPDEDLNEVMGKSFLKIKEEGYLEDELHTITLKKN